MGLTKMNNKVIISALCALGLSSVAHAFDPTQTPEAAIKHLQTLDCRADKADCRYYATMEVVGYFDTCMDVLGQRLKKVAPQEDEIVRTMLKDWLAKAPKLIRSAALDPGNKLRPYLDARTSEYLKEIPLDEAAIECSRISEAAKGKPAEDMSELLKATRNYNQWREPRQAAEQADFTRNQERLQQEARKRLNASSPASSQ